MQLLVLMIGYFRKLCVYLKMTQYTIALNMVTSTGKRKYCLYKVLSSSYKSQCKKIRIFKKLLNILQGNTQDRFKWLWSSLWKKLSHKF